MSNKILFYTKSKLILLKDTFLIELSQKNNSIIKNIVTEKFL